VINDRLGVDVALLCSGADEPLAGALAAGTAQVGQGHIQALLFAREPSEGHHDADHGSGDQQRDQEQPHDQLDGGRLRRWGKPGAGRSSARLGFDSLQIRRHQ
jgi:hypothetical protein